MVIRAMEFGSKWRVGTQGEFFPSLSFNTFPPSQFVLSFRGFRKLNKWKQSLERRFQRELAILHSICIDVAS